MSSDKSPKPIHLRLVEREPLILDGINDDEAPGSDTDAFHRDTLVDHTPLQLDMVEMLPTQTFDRGVIVQSVEANQRRRYYLILEGLAEQRFLKRDGSLGEDFKHLKKGDVIGITSFAEVKTATHLHVRVIDLDDIDRSNNASLIQHAHGLILNATLLAGNIARQEVLRYEDMVGELESVINHSDGRVNRLNAELNAANERADVAERRAKEIDALAKGDLKAHVNEVLAQKIKPLQEERDAHAATVRRIMPWLREFFKIWPELQAELRRLRKDQKADAISMADMLPFIRKEQGEEIDRLRQEIEKAEMTCLDLKKRMIEIVAPAIPKLTKKEDEDAIRLALDLLSELYALRIPVKFD